MKRISILLLSISLFLVISACQKAKQAGSGTGVDGVIAAPGETEISASLTPDNGGIVSFPQVAELAVGVGALDEETTVSAKKLPKLDQQGDLVPIQSAIQFGPEGLAFNKSATLKFCYSAAEVSAAGLSEKTVQVYYIDPDTGEYASVGGSWDKTNHCVSAEVSHFSTYLPAAQALLPGNNAPVIGAATYVPTTPIVGVPLRIRTVITDFDLNGAIATAYLYYRNGATGPFTKVALLPDSADVTAQVYYVDIPANQVTATAIRFYLEATDNLGAKRTLPAAAPATTTARTIPRILGALPNLQFKTPVPTNMSAGFARDFIVQVKDSGNTWRNVESASFAAINNLGPFTRVRTGSLTFTAQKNGIETLSATVNFAAGARSATTNVVINPGQVASLKILNNAGVPITGTLLIPANDLYQFDVLGTDNFGNSVLANPSFSTSGGVGTIDTSALFTSGSANADGMIVADLGGLSSSANISVRTRPYVSATTPSDSATGVNRRQSIAITFSEPMLPTTLLANDTPSCSGTVQVSNDNFASCVQFVSVVPAFNPANTVATLTPKVPMIWGANYTVRVLQQVASQNGIGMAADFSQTSGFIIMKPKHPLVGSSSTGLAIISKMIEKDDTLIIGGVFDGVGPQTGGGVTFDATTENLKLSATLAQIQGTVYAAIPDGSGGWYIGGEFGKVGSATRIGIARINADGSLHPFTADIAGPNDGYGVYALLIQNNMLYVGGRFDHIRGANRTSLAAIDLTTDTLTSWQPTIDGILPYTVVGAVKCLAASGDTLFVGGAFWGANGQSRRHLASYTISTGALDPFNPSPGGIISAMLVSGTTLYLGGTFTTMATPFITRNRLAAYDIPSGSFTGFNPDLNGDVASLDTDGLRLFIGGGFTTINGIARNRVAAISLATGALDPNLIPNVDNWVTRVQYVATKLYIGGYFHSVGGESRNFLAAVDAARGAVLPFNPNPQGYVGVIARQGNDLYVGGTFDSIGRVQRNNLAAIDMVSGLPTAFDPNVNGHVADLELVGQTLFVAGDFTSVGNQPRPYLAAVDADTGSLQTFAPAPDAIVSSISSSPTTLYVGGEFTTIAGVSRKGIAAFDIASTNILGTFNPNHDGNRILNVEYLNSKVYLSGTFNTFAGQPRTFAAEIDPSTGTPTANTMHVNSLVNSFSTDGILIYIAGGFTQINGQAANYAATMNPGSGVIVPLAVPGINNGINKLSHFGNQIIVAGNIQFSPSDNASRIVNMTQGGVVLNDVLLDKDSSILTFHHSSPALYLGGILRHNGGKNYSLAAYDLPTAAWF